MKERLSFEERQVIEEVLRAMEDCMEVDENLTGADIGAEDDEVVYSEGGRVVLALTEKQVLLIRGIIGK